MRRYSFRFVAEAILAVAPTQRPAKLIWMFGSPAVFPQRFAPWIAFAVLTSAVATSSPGQEPPTPPKTSKPKPKVERIAGDRFRIGKVEFDQKTREIFFSAKLNMTLGFLEYLLVNEITGKIHESLLTTEVSPLDLNVAMLLLSYKASDAIEKDKKDIALPAELMSSLDIVVRWQATDTDGKKVDREAPIEEWIHNLATETSATPGHWLYIGSKHDDYGNFAAEIDGSLIAVYNDPRSLLNNPREGKFSDEIWKPGKDLPEKETIVQITLRPHVAKP